MAEGFLRHCYGDLYSVFSAGTAPAGVSRYAVWVMEESGIDISGQRSKSIKEFMGKDFSTVITLCECAEEVCHVLPRADRVIHHPFPSPAGAGNDEEILDGFRMIRDQIRDWIMSEFS
jgi:arsenate reductase